MSEYWHEGKALPEGDEWDTEVTGLPGAQMAAQAIQVWSALQGRSVTVREAATAFNMADAQVRQAVSAHYWMFLEGPDDDPTKQTIEHEGE